MTELIKYDAARRMLAEAVAVDEVQSVLDKGEHLRLYAQQAKDRDLEIQAAQIRFRAERRLGELIKLQKETVGLARGGRPRSDKTRSDAEQVSAPITLEQAGIDRKLSSRAQRMAEIEPARFEQLIELHRVEVLEENNKVSVDLLRTSSEAEGRDKRRRLAQALSDSAAELPTGRLFPCAYIDPPWLRKQGVTDRSYENHYPTMTWPEIIALMERVAPLLLPDAWVFLWVPRAHMFALHPVDMEFADDDGRVITRKVKLPLAWAVARACGCDAYSTAFVWTKTDEDHPDDQGGGVLVFDQDEILLMFKRGRGLPKPATGEKFKSNHRERKREHSRKPDHYREMIRTMTGGVPVLELFARVDADHPLPPDWQAWGNQAAPIEISIADQVELEVVPPAPAPLSEYDALRAISLADQRDQAAPIVAAYVERRLAFYMNPDRTDWSLTVEGWKVLHRLERERADLAAGMPDGAAARAADTMPELAASVQPDAAAGPPALPGEGSPGDGIVDQSLEIASEADDAVPPAQRPGANFDDELAAQCRLPLDDAEMDLQLALTAIKAGEPVDGEIVRGLIGLGYAHATPTRVVVTEGGEAWLRSLIDVPPALDLPLFLERRESAA